jgi:hypothetical protein
LIKHLWHTRRFILSILRAGGALMCAAAIYFFHQAVIYALRWLAAPMICQARWAAAPI